ncbi:MAG: hypothetical protein MJ179_01800 [Treponema sp.]|nr:hypothetical protein [Treponema sp.]
MKKLSFVLCVFLAAIAISSCNKEKTETVADQSVAKTVDESGKEKSISLIPSVLFYDEGSLWFENADGELEWYITLNAGQTLYAYPASNESENEVVEAQKMKKAGKKDQDVYIKVLYDQKDYWILSDLVVADAKAAVVIEDTMNYSKDSIDGLSSKAAKVPVGKLVAIHNDYTCPADSDINFVKVTWRNGSERSYREVFLKSETVSTSVDDITAMRVNNKAASLKDETVIIEIVENVLSLSLTPSIEDIFTSNPVFSDYIL